jgi:hypothetical protein
VHAHLHVLFREAGPIDLQEEKKTGRVLRMELLATLFAVCGRTYLSQVWSCFREAGRAREDVNVVPRLFGILVDALDDDLFRAFVP